ncbi:pRiA4b ORF-3-like protein [Lentzea flava]|nr:pRiA4b ORF-3-like protein [Lentzea flava]
MAREDRPCDRTWLSIRVDLVGGGGRDLWPRPGRIFAAARSHTFAALATAIDDAFARWDRSHLHHFELADGRRVGRPDWEGDGEGDEEDTLLDGRTLTLGKLAAGEQFVYVFDLGDNWAHLCTVGPQRIDPLDELGIQPGQPLPYWGWGDIPDQYGRRWDTDDGQTPLPPDPGLADLPVLQPGWGGRHRC